MTVKWDDKNAIDILGKKVEEVSYPLGEDDRYTDESKDILNLVLNDDASTDSDGDVENCNFAYNKGVFKVTMHLQIDNFLQIWIFESKYWSKCDLWFKKKIIDKD